MQKVPSAPTRVAALTGAYLAVYSLAALWASELTLPGGSSPWFPGAGLAIALLILAGPIYAPVVVAGELISSQLIFQASFTAPQAIISATAFTAAMCVAAVPLRQLLGDPPSFRDATEVRAFAILGVLVAPALAGVAIYSMLAWSGIGSWDGFLSGWWTFAVGDAVGIAAVAPAVIAIAARLGTRQPLQAPTLRPEPIVQAVAIVGLPLLPLLQDGSRPMLLALTLVPVAWVALTRSFLTASLASLVAISITTITAHAELGNSVQLTDVQFFLMTEALLGTGIAVMMRMFRRSQAALAVRASQDPLTGLANRRNFIEEVERRLSAGERAAILFIDLDRFKLVNDTLGHEVGDAVLVTIAGRLARTGVPGQALVARFGGDEFTAVTSAAEPSSWLEGERMADRVLEELRAPIAIGDRQVSIDVSVGITVGDPGDDPEELVSRADLAMFSAKQRGGSRVSMFDDSMRERAARRLDLERGLREALEGDRGLSLAYQPIVPLRATADPGIEALMRWRTPSGEDISPGEFIPIAEETGLILKIGRWVLKEACQAASTWPDLGLSAPTVWVNVSAAELREPDFVNFVVATLASSGLERGSLGLEVTEGVLIEDSQSILATMQELHDAGVRLTLDDFGTGYSSLGYLQRLPIDSIKIDRRFVSGLSMAENENPVPATIIDLAHRLAIDVVGEGVETVVQQRALERLGCDLAQGWLFGRPGSAEQAITALRGRVLI